MRYYWRQFLFVIGISVILSALSRGPLAQTSGTETADALNEFDLASYCVGLEYSHTTRNFTEIHLGYVSVGEQPHPEFLYITSRYYVPLGPYGDPGECEFRRYLHRFAADGRFVSEQITDEAEYSQIRSKLASYKQSNPSQYYDYRAARPDDSIGGCLFTIYWYAVDGSDYTLLSLPYGDGIVGYVIPHYLRAMNGAPSQCYAWGERHLTNESVVSSGLTLFPFADGRLFVAMEKFQKGLLFKTEPDFQCVPGRDAFRYHLLVKRKFFDAKLRPGLEDIYQKSGFADRPKDGPSNGEIISFADSVYLNRQFAKFLTDFAKQRSCD